MATRILFLVFSIAIVLGSCKGSQTDSQVANSPRLEAVLQMSLEQRNEMLRTAHQRMYGLPYPQDVIVGQIMPDIRYERHRVAPDFPERPTDGSDVERAIYEWLANHPDQFANYLDFLEEKYNEHLNRARE